MQFLKLSMYEMGPDREWKFYFSLMAHDLSHLKFSNTK